MLVAADLAPGVRHVWLCTCGFWTVHNNCLCVQIFRVYALALLQSGRAALAPEACLFAVNCYILIFIVLLWSAAVSKDL